MYEQLDGNLAWGDLRSAVRAGFRSPWVPQHWLQDGPRYLYLGLCTSTWAFQTDLRSQETSKRPPGLILKQFWTPPGGPGGPQTQ